jgi:hypothetical protein
MTIAGEVDALASVSLLHQLAETLTILVDGQEFKPKRDRRCSETRNVIV